MGAKINAGSQFVDQRSKASKDRVAQTAVDHLVDYVLNGKI